MIQFIKVIDKYTNEICWININHIEYIRVVAGNSVIKLHGENNTIVVDDSPTYLFNIMNSENSTKI